MNPLVAYHKQAELATRTANRPLATRYGLGYGLMAVVYSAAQVVIASSVAVAHQAELVTLQHASDPNSGIPFIPSVLFPIITSIATCFIFGIISILISYYAALQAAHTTRNDALGRRAGIIAQLLGWAGWAVWSVVGALVTGTDGAVLSVDPFHSSTSSLSLEGIVLLALGRALFVGGLGFVSSLLFINIGAQDGRNKVP